VTDNVLTVVKGAVRAAFGIRTALQNLAKTGPMVCEVQQHLAKFILPSIAGQMAETPWKSSACLSRSTVCDRSGLWFKMPRRACWH
jgi:hypothetical protein